MSYLYSPVGNSQFFDADVALVGAKLFTYLAGSTTKVTVYKNSSGSSSHTNPIVLDANGRPASPVFLLSGQTYKFVLAPSNDTDPPGSPYYTWDNVSAINDVVGSQDEWVSGPTPTYIGATQFSVAGDQTALFEVGRRVKAIIGAGTVYGRITVSAFTALTTVTVVLDSGSLDSGLTAVSYGLLSATNQSIPVLTSPVINSATGIGQSLVKRKTADESVTSSTTLQDDDHLVFPIGANEEWVASYSIDCGALIVNSGIKFAITVPAGATMDAFAVLDMDDSADTASMITGRTTSSGSTIIGRAAGIGPNDAVISLNLWVLNGATPGNVTLQWAQFTSSGSALTFRKGSFLIPTRVA